MQHSILLDDVFKVAVQLRVSDEPVQLSSGQIHCSCQAFEILDFYDAPPCNSNDFLILGNPGGR